MYEWMFETYFRQQHLDLLDYNAGLTCLFSIGHYGRGRNHMKRGGGGNQDNLDSLPPFPPTSLMLPVIAHCKIQAVTSPERGKY